MSLDSSSAGTPPTPKQRLLFGLLFIGGKQGHPQRLSRGPSAHLTSPDDTLSNASGKWGYARLRRYALTHGWSEEPEGSLVWTANRILEKGEAFFRLAW